jgi:3',5'-nucleoside bisphosphate phosphatase
MPNPIDFHTHSNASDGELSPAQLVQHAEACGIQRLALTDHDTVAGIAAARAAAQTLELIGGIELSVSWHSHVIHILGLNIDPDNAILVQGLTTQQHIRHKRALDIAALLEQQGIVRTAYAGAQRFAHNDFIGRTHFALYLVEQGIAPSIQKVFKRYLVRGKPGYVATQWASMQQALTWIQAAGGVAVLAHPARYKITRTKLKQLLQEFKHAGGIGLEVISGSHQREDNIAMARLAKEFGFYGSIGSDYHSPQNLWCELGTLPYLPPDCPAVWDLF